MADAPHPESPAAPTTAVSAAPVAAGTSAASRAKALLEAGRTRILAAHRAGAGGQEVVRAFSQLTDEVLVGLCQDLWFEVAGLEPDGYPRMALVATGGYGRRELAPRSDVDLLALLPDDGDPGREIADEVASRLHRALWDAGLEAGFAARTLEQCLQAARADQTVRTALLDSRLVCGDLALFKALERSALRELEARRVEEFIDAKLQEFRERRARYGGSVWLLEPHLKQGKGGLRDLQGALWIARARHKVAGLGEAGERGLIPGRELHTLRAARDLLWRLRNELHVITGRRDDRLTFDNQRKLAASLGYQDTETELGVERLMRETYTALQEVARASDALIDRCAVEDAPKQSAAAGLGLGAALSAGLGLVRRRPPQAKPIDGAFKLWNGRVTVADKDVFARRPADLVRIFAVAETYDAPIYSYARDLLLSELHRLGEQLAADREAHFELWQLLTRDGSEGAQLVPMHELGVLGAVVPELGRLRARAQHSLYHVYTVDTHTVFAVQRLCRLRANGLEDVEPELTRIVRALQRPLPLMLGLLFHDLGKGLGGDHSRRGAEMAFAYALRSGLDPNDAADMRWLVSEHLTMSLISQRRDLEDPELIAEFARSCGTVERLEMMYLLTYADMASVSAENWNAWKAGLLRTLYERARVALLTHDAEAPSHEKVLEARREHLAAQLAPRLQPQGEPPLPGRPRSPGAPQRGGPVQLAHEFVNAAPERYLATVRPDDAARHLELWLQARRSGFASELRRPASGEAELTLLAPDRPGLLALFAAALAASGIDVLAAEAHTLAGGVALDRFVVREPGGGAPAQGRWENAKADLLKLLSGADDPGKLVNRKLRRAAFGSAQPAVRTKLRTDNVSSRGFTVLDVMAQDRPGLLFAIAEALREAGVSIGLARVATEGNRATDAFYLSDERAGGGKLTSDARMAEVERAVQEAIDRLPV